MFRSSQKNKKQKITTGAPVNEVGAFFGCAWVDYDNDGFPDLFVTTRQPDTSTRNHLYRNNGNGSFTKVTTVAIVTDTANSRGCTWGDFDNDGFPDVVVATRSGVLFYRNNRDARFLKVTNPFSGTAGVALYGLGWVDYDRDGLLDLFVPKSGNSLLYRNLGDGTFARVTGQPIVSDSGSSAAAAWGDYDNDGWPDVYVSNYPGELSFLYRNAANGTFDRILTGPIVTKTGNWAPAAWGDYNNDGLLDLFAGAGAALFAESDSLYQNNGAGDFTEITTGAIVTEARNSEGCVWGDYDNDGFLDLFVANSGGNNLLYHNNGDGSFELVIEGSLVNDGGYSIGCGWSDYDNDGFLDLFVANGGRFGPIQKNFLYRNNGNGNAWMKVRCVGTVSNRSAIGAKVRVRATLGGKTFWQLREISSSSGLGGNDLISHFGLGNATNIEALRVEWPSGIVQEFHDVAPRQFLTVREPSRLQVSGPGTFRVQSWKGMAFEVQASIDLNQWSPVTTVTNLTGTLEFMDPDAANQLRRFYRAVLK